MKTDRPVNLNMFTITLPLVGVLSFIHRVTGMALFVGVAFGLYALDLALSSQAGFAEATALLAEPLARFIFLGLIFSLVYHIVAGVKHIFMDFHIGDSLEAARVNAYVVIVATVVITGVVGALLW
jgi:succinate dehydrogenase / fumarate reductase cytochrome b subunit